MMDTQEKILALLAGHDSKKPMSFDDLAEKTGLLYATLEMVLEQMHHQVPAPINCAQITRGGKTQMVYWPTGMVDSKVQPFSLHGTPAKKPVVTTSPPRRERVGRIHIPELAPTTSKMAEQAVKHMETAMTQEKPKSRSAS